MTALLAQFFEPLTFEFMRQAYLLVLVIAPPLSLLSCYLVLKGWALLGDAISHAVLPGVVIAYVLGLPLALGAFLSGMLCALLTGYLNEHSRIKEDTVMGVVFSSLFALGLVLYVAVDSAVHLDHILFGDLLGLVWRDIAHSALIAASVLVFLLVWGRDLTLVLFDSQHARAIGLPLRALTYGLLAALSMAVVSALQAVGIILAIALLIGPGATAFLLTRRFDHMRLWAVAVAVLASLSGITISFYIESAPAPTIVVVLTLLFLAAFASDQFRMRRAAQR